MIRIDTSLVNKVSEAASHSPRRRMNHNFHKQADDTLQRMLNAMEPDTYIAPHKHQQPDKREAFIILQGAVLLVEFTEEGKITGHVLMDREQGVFGAEVPPRTYHTLICLEPGSVIYEIKDGPYDVSTDKIFAPWAPAEADPAVADFNKKILRQIGLA